MYFAVKVETTKTNPRMIRDGDVNDEELGFEVDYSRKLG